MQIPDRRIKKMAELFNDIKKWNEFHPQTPLPCGFVDKLEEDLQYLEARLTPRNNAPKGPIKL